MTGQSFSIITYCKGRLEHLKRALPTFVAQNDAEVIVVDYDCPDRAKDWLASNMPAVRVAAVTDAPIFNLSRARNIAAPLARAPWLVFCDADQLLAPSFASETRKLLAPDVFLRPEEDTPEGSRKIQFPLICAAAAFQSCGGFDDAFRGWGGADREFLRRLVRLGLRDVTYPMALVETLQHTNAARSSHYEHSIDTSVVINHHYARIKERYFETRGRWFTDEQRHATYGRVERVVLAAIADRQSDTVFDIEIAGSAPPWTARLSAATVRKYHDDVVSGLFRVEL